MNGCGTFAWIDRQQVEWQRVVINQLLLEKRLLDRQVDHLKQQVCALEDQASNAIRQYEKVKVNSAQKQTVKPKKGEVNYVLSVAIGFMIATIVLFVTYATK